MATINLKPPEPLTSHKPYESTHWNKHFKQYHIASGLSKAREEHQVSMLLYFLGEDAEDVLWSTYGTSDDRATYQGVCAKLDAFFQVRRNVIYDFARFNSRVQHESEMAEQHIVILYNLAENCK